MTRILIVDDQEMIRLGLRAILEQRAGFEVVGEAADGFAALHLLAEQAVDVVLMDIRMPGIDGVETTRRIRQRWPAEDLRVVVLTTFEHDENVVAALRAGANGFLSKSAGPSELAAAIEEVAAGGGALSPAAARALIGRVATERSPVIEPQMAALFETLTPRERDVVAGLMTGKDLGEIAAERHLSPFTVKTHANRAMAKVGAHDRAQLVAFAFRAGLNG